LEDALLAGERLGGDLPPILGYWNPAGAPPARTADAYRAAAAAAPSGGRLAVKLPAIANDADVVAELLATGVAVHADSVGPSAADAAYELLASVYKPRGAPPVGCTLPGRWRRSTADAETALELGLRPRLVKGQFPGPARDERDPGRGIRELAVQLAGRAVGVSVASHDAPVAEAALRELLAAGTPVELELLYGLPAAGSLAVARRLDVPVRWYIPYGAAFLPYAARAVLHHPRAIVWLARDLVIPDQRTTSRSIAILGDRHGPPATSHAAPGPRVRLHLGRRRRARPHG
jgi:proline dehydrogenase